MTNQAWLDVSDETDPSERDAALIERDNGIAPPDDQDPKNPVRTLMTGIVLPVVIVGIILIVAMWFLIREFNLLGQ